jgi:hypothetical protein
VVDHLGALFQTFTIHNSFSFLLETMGNAISVSTQTYFFTSCMAKYTRITKPQVMAIRNILVSLATVTSDKPKPRNVESGTNSEPLMIRRRHLYQAVQKTNIVMDPDHDVLELLFTMWTNPENEKSKTQVPWYEFMISISLLACKTDTLDQALRFALHVVSRNHSSDMGRMISASDAIAFLNGKSDSIPVNKCRFCILCTGSSQSNQN